MDERIEKLIEQATEIYNDFMNFNFLGMPEEWNEIHDEYYTIFTDGHLDEIAERITEEINESELEMTGSSSGFDTNKVRDFLDEYLYSVATEVVPSETNVVYKEGLNRFMPKEIDSYTDGSSISFSDAMDYISSDLDLETLESALLIGEYHPETIEDLERVGLDTNRETEDLIADLTQIVNGGKDQLHTLNRHMDDLWERIDFSYSILESELDDTTGVINVFNTY